MDTFANIFDSLENTSPGRIEYTAVSDARIPLLTVVKWRHTNGKLLPVVFGIESLTILMTGIRDSTPSKLRNSRVE